MRAIMDSGRPVVTVFVERGTGTRELEQRVGEVAERVGEGAIFGVVDVAENPSIAQKFAIQDSPSVALFRDGKHLGTTDDVGGDALAAFVQRTLTGR
jgi:thioredoxin-like negative regulator of GroEL